MTRILLAVDDSPAGLAAARTAVELARAWSAQLRAVHVLTDGGVERALADRPAGGTDRLVGTHGGPGVDVHGRRDQGAVAVLRHVTDLAARAHVPVQTVARTGHPARCILEEASAWGADLVVLGRSGTRHLGQPYVGSEVQHVLEFADLPVLVVPPPPASRVR